MITTIVLVNAEPRLIPKAAAALAGIEGVTDVYSVSGEWDLVVIVKVKNYEDIANVVTEHFPTVAAAVAALVSDDLVLDGEVCALDANGRPSFNLLQNRLGLGRGGGKATLSYPVFDVLFIDGDHSYEGAKNDWDAYKNFLHPGSVVIFHDYGWAEGVKRVIEEDAKPVTSDYGSLPNLWWGTIR